MSRDDRGAGAVLVLGTAALLLLVAATAATLTAVAVARQRAAAVADLAALAAAQHALDGPIAACNRARRTSAADAGRLLSCVLLGDVAELTVEVRPPGPLGGLGAARSRARAGPPSGGAR